MDNFNYVVGSLIVANIATIITVIVAAARGVWFIARLELRVTQNEKDVNSAFLKIRDTDEKLFDLRSEISNH